MGFRASGEERAIGEGGILMKRMHNRYQQQQQQLLPTLGCVELRDRSVVLPFFSYKTATTVRCTFHASIKQYAIGKHIIQKNHHNMEHDVSVRARLCVAIRVPWSIAYSKMTDH